MKIISKENNQEVQLDEIIALNKTLEEEKKNKLEKLAAEQEAQLDEITKLNKNLTERIHIIQSMSKIYFACFYVDFENDSYEDIAGNEAVRRTLNQTKSAREAVKIFCDNMVSKDTKDEIEKFLDFSTLNERMADRDVITCNYVGKVAGWCLLHIIAVDRHEDGTLKTIFIASRTINEEMARERAYTIELERAKKAAEDSNKAKTVFLSNMSHDIRTPMNAILGFTRLMRKAKDQPDVIEGYLNKIETSGEYLLNILNNVLELTKIDSGAEEIDESAINILRGQEAVLAIVENEVKRKNLKFNVEVNIEHEFVLTDDRKLKEIVVNLLTNAINYTPEGGAVTFRLKEQPCEKEGYATYVTEVSDTGIGMSEEFQKRVFDSFARENNTTESKVFGTGLGMSIVKRFVDLLGGTIEVESELGKGTTFRITMSSKIVDAPEVFHEKVMAEVSERSDFSGSRILLAEDNMLNAEIAVELLEDVGFEVDHAIDGVECVDMLVKADAGYYDLILMDIQMPNLNGYMASDKIRKLPDVEKANIPIVAMTANAFDEDRKMALASGMNDHIAKPIDVPKLMRILSTIVK